MSVNDRMKAIADRIRTIRGISGTMGLEAIASNLGTVQTHLNSAFSAVDSKGGTVPSSKVSGNLESAIQSIPAGGSVLTKTGTFATAADGSAAVDCGFKPDVVTMFVTVANEDGDYYHPVFAFTPLNTECVVQCSEAAEYFMYVGASRTSTGFTIDWANNYSFDWEQIGSPNQEFRYAAVKYT